MVDKQGSSKLIPYAKISETQTERIIEGIATAENLTEMSQASGVSTKTCRSIILPLRYRFFRAPFHPFQQWKYPFALRPDVEKNILAMIYSYFARCYFDRKCQSNYEHYRRQARVCRGCPLRELGYEGEDLFIAVHNIDVVRAFYGMLGIGGERDVKPLTCFRLRLIHMQVVGQAWEDTRNRVDGSDMPDFSQTGVGTSRHLYDTIIKELEREPLARRSGPIDEIDDEYGDLIIHSE